MKTSQSLKKLVTSLVSRLPSEARTTTEHAVGPVSGLATGDSNENSDRPTRCHRHPWQALLHAWVAGLPKCTISFCCTYPLCHLVTAVLENWVLFCYAFNVACVVAMHRDEQCPIHTYAAISSGIFGSKIRGLACEDRTRATRQSTHQLQLFLRLCLFC